MRELRFTNKLFNNFMDGFIGSSERNPRIAAKILDKIDKISKPRFDDIDQTQQPAQIALMESMRSIDESTNKTLVLENAEYDFALKCIKSANWVNWAAQSGVELEDWLAALPDETLEQIEVRHAAEVNGVLKLG